MFAQVTSASTAAALLLAAAPAATLAWQNGFPLGVAAGDVTAQSAVVWTRPAQPATLTLQLAADETFDVVLLSTQLEARPDDDRTVRHNLEGLTPSTRYFYRFIVDDEGSSSPVGTFRTAPPSDQPMPFRFVFTGDSDAAAQPFRLLNSAAAEGADFWFWFGDTIYADVPAGGLGVATTLDAYRAKHAQNRTDPHLQALLASTPVWAGWDDHEATNDYDGGDPEPGLTRAQIEAAYRAFFEYMPIQRAADPDDPWRLYRSFRYGELAEFFILDGRQYRSADAARVFGGGWETLDPFGFLFPPANLAYVRIVEDGGRTMLGAAQREWLKAAVSASTAQFKFIINPVPFTSLLVLPDDRWDGYDAERYDLLRSWDLAGVRGVVILTTDSHGNAVNPDLTAFLRTRRGRTFSPGFAAPELIAGPIATGTVGGVLRRVALELFGGAGAIGAPLAADLLVNFARCQVVRLNQLSFLEADRYAYLVVDVRPEGVTLTHRGYPPADNAGPAQVATLNAVELDADGRAPAPPCVLFPLAAAAVGVSAYAGGARSLRRGRARGARSARRPPA